MKPTDHDQHHLAEAYAKIGDTELNTTADLVAKLKEYMSKGATYVSFMYSPKTGGQFIYLINVGLDYDRITKEALEKLKAYTPKSDVEQIALDEMIASREQKLTKGVSDSYTNKDTYDFYGKGIKINKETGTLQVMGVVENKTVVVPGPEKKPVRSGEKTIAKSKIEKELGINIPWGNFILDPSQIGGVKIKGDVIEFHE